VSSGQITLGNPLEGGTVGILITTGNSRRLHCRASPTSLSVAVSPTRPRNAQRSAIYAPDKRRVSVPFISNQLLASADSTEHIRFHSAVQRRFASCQPSDHSERIWAEAAVAGRMLC
jgi:hypothetical protein